MLKRVIGEKQFWILILLGILYFYEPLFTDRTFFFRDLFLHFFPERNLFTQTIRAGELPLWDPYVHGGQPLLGDVQNLILYPTGILYFFLPLITAFNVEIVFHFLLCSAATYALARVLKLSPAAAFVAAILYTYNGYTLSLANLMNRLLAMPYLPLLLLFWHQFLNESKWRWFVLATVCGAFQLFAGAPEMTLITFGFVGLWSMFYPYPQSASRKVGYWLLLVLFVAGLAAIQILPGMEMTSQSGRAAPGGLNIFGGWSLNPKRLPELLISNFSGYTDKLAKKNYWGAANEDMGFPYILSIYLGALTLVFCAGAVSRNSSSVLPPGVRKLLFLMVVCSIIFSLGRYLPFFDYAYKVAILNRLRYPIKFLAAGLLPVALLAAAYTDTLFDPKQRPSTILAVLWTITGVLFSVLLLFLLSQNTYIELLRSYFGRVSGAQDLLSALEHTIAICLAVTLILQLRRLRFQNWQSWAFVAVLALDLLYAGYFVNWYASREFFRTVPNLVRLVWSQKGDGRFFRTIDPKGIHIAIPGDDSFYQFRWMQETLTNYVGASYGIPVIYHEDYDGLGKTEIQKLASFVYKSPLKETAPVLAASGISLLFTPQRIDHPAIQLIAQIRTNSDQYFYLYRNINAQRARFVSGVIAAQNSEDALNRMKDPRFDPTRVVILEQPVSIEPAGSCDSALVPTTSKSTLEVYRVRNACPGYVVFAEAYYPGWVYQVDGNPAAVLPANYAFSAVKIGPGEHVVSRTYNPRSVKHGAAISFLFTILLVVIGFVRKRKDGTD